MRKHKREVEFEGNVYKVRSDKIEIPDFSKMETFTALTMACHAHICAGIQQAT